MTYQEKIQILKKLRSLIYKYQNDIVNALKKDLNKSEHETLMSEIYPTVKEINYFLRNLWKYKDVKRVNFSLFSKKGYVYNPRGNVLIMNTWNYPINLLFIPLIGSIACGNYSIVKLHPFVLETKKVIEKIINELDPQEEHLKIDDSYTFADMFEAHNIDFLFFTGSSQTASKLKKFIVKNNIEYCFELGGKSPFIVTKNANLDKAVDEFFYGKILNGGQTCVAPDYIFIDKSIAESFSKKVQAKFDNFYQNQENLSQFPHLINEHSLERIGKYIENDDMDVHLLQVKPQIIQTNDLTSSIYHEEIFAPISPMYVYNNINEFDHVYNQNPNPLAFYLFSNSKEDWNYFRKFKTGNFMVNNTISVLEDNKLSFGGYKESGFGRYRGKESFELFSVKSSFTKVHLNLFKSIKNYPYKNWKTKLIKVILKLNEL